MAFVVFLAGVLVGTVLLLYLTWQCLYQVGSKSVCVSRLKVLPNYLSLAPMVSSLLGDHDKDCFHHVSTLVNVCELQVCVAIQDR